MCSTFRNLLLPPPGRCMIVANSSPSSTVGTSTHHDFRVGAMIRRTARQRSSSPPDAVETRQRTSRQQRWTNQHLIQHRAGLEPNALDLMVSTHQMRLDDGSSESSTAMSTTTRQLSLPELRGNALATPISTGRQRVFNFDALSPTTSHDKAVVESEQKKNQRHAVHCAPVAHHLSITPVSRSRDGSPDRVHVRAARSLLREPLTPGQRALERLDVSELYLSSHGEMLPLAAASPQRVQAMVGDIYTTRRLEARGKAARLRRGKFFLDRK